MSAPPIKLLAVAMASTALYKGITTQVDILDNQASEYYLGLTAAIKYGSLALPFIYDPATVFPQLLKLYLAFAATYLLLQAMTYKMKEGKTKKFLNAVRVSCGETASSLLPALALAWMRINAKA